MFSPDLTATILTLPYRAGDTAELAKVQRSFTAYTDSVKDLNYWDRLKITNLFLLEHRYDKYIIIYVCEILQGLVPNLHTKMIPRWIDALGRMCRLDLLKSRDAVENTKGKNMNLRGPLLITYYQKIYGTQQEDPGTSKNNRAVSSKVYQTSQVAQRVIDINLQH